MRAWREAAPDTRVLPATPVAAKVPPTVLPAKHVEPVVQAKKAPPLATMGLSLPVVGGSVKGRSTVMPPTYTTPATQAEERMAATME
jgi:hypothetical protein